MTTTKTNPKKLMPLIGGVIGVAALIFTIQKIIYARNHEETDNSQIECNIIPISPRISGYVQEVYVSENQFVHKGDTLVRLDSRDLELKLHQAEIQAKAATANAAVTRSNESSASASADASSTSIATAQANVDAVKAQWELSKSKYSIAADNFKRYEQLYNQTSATKVQYDAAWLEKQTAEKQMMVLEKQVMAAETQLQAAKQQALAVKDQASGINSQVDMANINIKQKESEVSYAALQLSYAYITSPCDGYVSKKNIQPGQLVNIGQTLMSLVDDSKLWINANFKETQIENMKVGQKVEIKVDAHKGHAFKGKIESMQAATGSKFTLLPPDNATGNFVKVVQRIPVRISVIDRKHDQFTLRAGMNVTVHVKTNE